MTTPTSPFGRKVKIAAFRCGVAHKLQIEAVELADPADKIRIHNPLAKVPALNLGDGTTLYDSRVICEYLDFLNLGAKIFPEPPERWNALTLAALGDGIMEASILQIYEHRFRPEEKVHPHWLEYQQAKVDRSLNFLENQVPAMPEAANIGHITLACALGFLDFRFAGAWRDNHPHLVEWLENFEQRVPTFKTTDPAI